MRFRARAREGTAEWLVTEEVSGATIYGFEDANEAWFWAMLFNWSGHFGRRDGRDDERCGATGDGAGSSLVSENA